MSITCDRLAIAIVAAFFFTVADVALQPVCAGRVDLAAGVAELATLGGVVFAGHAGAEDEKEGE